jgi:hypothetical protein
MARAGKTFLSDQMAVRLPRELRQALEVAASEERRSPSSLIRIFIEDAMKHRAAGSQQTTTSAAA